MQPADLSLMGLLFSYSPILDWFMNVASPHLGIPATIFYFGTLRKYFSRACATFRKSFVFTQRNDDRAEINTDMHLYSWPAIFFFSSLVGVLPNTLVTVQAGVTLAALASPDDFTLLTPENIIMTVVICICLLIPIILHRNSEDPTADPKPVEEDGAAQV